MDVLSSAEFRKVYAKLTKPTAVTANGHPIGVWVPGVPDELTMTRGTGRSVGAAMDEVEAAHRASFNSRPFTPVPKTRK